MVIEIYCDERGKKNEILHVCTGVKGIKYKLPILGIFKIPTTVTHFDRSFSPNFKDGSQRMSKGWAFSMTFHAPL